MPLRTYHFVVGSATLRWMLAAASLILASCNRAPRPELNVSQKRDLSISVNLNRNFKDGSFQENETKNYRLSLDGNGAADLFDGGAAIGRFQVNSEGRFESSVARLPHELELIFHALPSRTSGDFVRVGSTWSVIDPTDETIRNESALISIQEKRDYRVADISSRDPNKTIEWRVEGYLKVFDNAGLRTFVGPATDPNSAGEKAIQALSAWNLYLIGTTTWSVQNQLPVKGDFTYVLVPGSGRTRSIIENAGNRQRLSFNISP